MSRPLMQTLNGNRTGLLKRWLDQNPDEPRIAWYPSAGQDFRDLLFLNPNYVALHPAKSADPAPPNLFLHTDAMARREGCFLNNPVLFEDGDRTCMRVVEIEELPRCELPLLYHPLTMNEPGDMTHRVFFLRVAVRCHRLGEFDAHVLYACAENMIFCAEFMLPAGARVSHLIQVRYGHWEGGARIGPAWLRPQIAKLGVEVFISDGTEELDQRELRRVPPYLFPTLELTAYPRIERTHMRSIPQRTWDGYQAIDWWKIEHADNVRREDHGLHHEP